MYIKIIKQYLTYEIGQVLNTTQSVVDRLEALEVCEKATEKEFKTYNKSKAQESIIAKAVSRTKPKAKEGDCDCEKDGDCEDCKDAEAKKLAKQDAVK